MKLFKNYEDIINHCPNSIYNAVEYAIDKVKTDHNFGMEKLYASIMAYMEMTNLYDKNMLCNNSDFSNRIDKNMTNLLPKSYDRAEEVLCLSSLLHLIHLKQPDVHEHAIGIVSQVKEEIAHEKDIDLSLTCKVVVPCPEFITGKDAFPNYLSCMIEEALAPYRQDLSVRYGITWENSHYDNGSEYNYDISEDAYVQISSIYSNSLEMAKETLDKITLEDVRAYCYESHKNMIYQQIAETEIPENAADSILSQKENQLGIKHSGDGFCSYITDGQFSFSPGNLISPEDNSILPMFTVETENSNILYILNDYASLSMLEDENGIDKQMLIFINEYYDEDQISMRYYNRDYDEEDCSDIPWKEKSMVTNCGVPYQIYVFDKDETAEFQEGWFDEMVEILSAYINNHYREEFEEEEESRGDFEEEEEINNIDEEMTMN